MNKHVYWYIRHESKGPVHCKGGGAWSTREDQAWIGSINDMTIFDRRSDAQDILECMRKMHTKLFGDKFKLIKVTRITYIRRKQ